MADLRTTEFNVSGNGVKVTTAADRRRRALDERAHALMDSLRARIGARTDSVDQLRELADQLEDSAAEASPAERRGLQRQADSARTP
ncbi:MAG: hypothetical protein IPK12_09050 [Gemmatimonadetes bacterium]|nr:hypothetical protein [Gemmatimonadota bacterium]